MNPNSWFVSYIFLPFLMDYHTIAEAHLLDDVLLKQAQAKPQQVSEDSLRPGLTYIVISQRLVAHGRYNFLAV
jgi:hypothetical protein